MSKEKEKPSCDNCSHTAVCMVRAGIDEQLIRVPMWPGGGGMSILFTAGHLLVGESCRVHTFKEAGR